MDWLAFFDLLPHPFWLASDDLLPPPHWLASLGLPEEVPGIHRRDYTRHFPEGRLLKEGTTPEVHLRRLQGGAWAGDAQVPDPAPRQDV